jgi:quinol-cytochrome oxidoreductase complex cytochrome b subunit
MPVYTVAGAALMGTFVISVAGVVFYQAIAPFYPASSIAPDWLFFAPPALIAPLISRGSEARANLFMVYTNTVQLLHSWVSKDGSAKIPRRWIID